MQHYGPWLASSSVHGILQAGILSGLPCPPPGDIPDPVMDATTLMSPALASGFFITSSPLGSPLKFTSRSLISGPQNVTVFADGSLWK